MLVNYDDIIPNLVVDQTFRIANQRHMSFYCVCTDYLLGLAHGDAQIKVNVNDDEAIRVNLNLLTVNGLLNLLRLLLAFAPFHFHQPHRWTLASFLQSRIHLLLLGGFTANYFRFLLHILLQGPEEVTLPSRVRPLHHIPSRLLLLLVDHRLGSVIELDFIRYNVCCQFIGVLPVLDVNFAIVPLPFLPFHVHVLPQLLLLLPILLPVPLHIPILLPIQLPHIEP